MLEVGKCLEPDARKAMRKVILVRLIAEDMIDNEIFEEEILNQLPVDVQEISQAQIEPEKDKLTARTIRKGTYSTRN